MELRLVSITQHKTDNCVRCVFRRLVEMKMTIVSIVVNYLVAASTHLSERVS